MAKRGHGEGTIVRHKKTGKWMAQASIGYDHEGKLKRITKYFETRKEAQDWLAKVQHEKNTGQFVEPDRITVAEWVARYLETYVKPKVRPTSYSNYHDALRLHIIPAIGHIPLQSLKTHMIQDFYNQKAETLSAWMIHRIHQILNGALKQAVRERLIPNNPAEYTVRPSIKRKEMAVLSPEEVDRYLEAARNDRLYPAFLLELTTGLRRGELLALTWDCIDFAKGTLTVKKSLTRVRYVEEGRTRLEMTDPKTESSKRLIPLLPEVIQELRRLKKKQAEERLFFGQAYQDNNLVFAQENGKPIDPRTFDRRHKAILKKAGLKHVRVHDLRHTVATILIQEGENPENLRDLLGHTRTSTTLDLYCHSTMEGKKKAVERLKAVLSQLQ
ncbi:MAG: site-specific integrase [Syntrophothermus sp.]|uniref:site-specific integrase n=1 Tax=Syntrophothermus sp. TaxID=2736299 RepID=UPI002580FD4C|nr:site-specific integrase [Syntrophothermus sp.]NSW84270.1 site-specific integrase [Syntrophothermus sp.]